jgi:hypothetical protein
MNIKVKNLKCFPQVAAVIGEVRAEQELLKVAHCKDCHDDYTDHHDIEYSFTWKTSPQGYDFWSNIYDEINPYTGE